jgi:hypothetical protein
MYRYIIIISSSSSYLTANGFLPGDSCTRITHITQNTVTQRSNETQHTQKHTQNGNTTITTML